MAVPPVWVSRYRVFPGTARYGSAIFTGRLQRRGFDFEDPSTEENGRVKTSTLEKRNLEGLDPGEIRALIREGKWTGRTEGLARGYAQANLVMLPREDAFDFLLFCLRNPKPCPLLEVLDPGSPIVRKMASGADLRADLPKYCIYERGECVAEVDDVTSHWRDDLVSFLIGCSFSFSTAFHNASIPIKTGSLYTTNIPCVPAGRFAGPLVVSMKAVPQDKVVRAVQVTSRFPVAHGAPIHIGNPEVIGIKNLNNDLSFHSRNIRLEPGDIPIFWACGCTPQAVALESKPDFMITHSSGCCFITDKLLEEIAAL